LQFPYAAYQQRTLTVTTELNFEELEAVAGGDKAKASAALAAYKVIHEIDKLLQPDPEPAVHVPMKL